MCICIGGEGAMKAKTPALMLQGTSSNAGKSVLAAAFCRIFQQDGYAVAPFKAQNMSLHSGVTVLGQEMGRAQIVQAQAARVTPDARMNPVLLKPHSDTGSQVVVLGKALGHMRVKEYFAKKKELWHTVAEAYDALAQEYDVMVLEGAGSPAEINLKEHDIVNMRMAAHAEAAVLLVGDIDRGGVYASFLGTWHTFTEAEKKLLTGYVVNRFRGDASYLDSAHDYMLEKTQVPVLGVIPHMHDLGIPEEDMAGCIWSGMDTVSQGNTHVNGTEEDSLHSSQLLDVGVILLRHMSNYTDMAPLQMEKDVCLRPISSVQDFGTPHVVIIPGSKSVVADLELLRENGLAQKILEHAAQNKWIFGICGGLQMLGKEIHDPYGVEKSLDGAPDSQGSHMYAGLGILDICSTFAEQKTLLQVSKAQTPLGVQAHGYEIHHGKSWHTSPMEGFFYREVLSSEALGSVALGSVGSSGSSVDKNSESTICGYAQGTCYATYLHGIFDDDTFRRVFINQMRMQVNLPVSAEQGAVYNLEKALDRLADVVRKSCDMSAIYAAMGLK